MLPIRIEFVPQESQRYLTCGDYFEEDGTRVFRITNLGNEAYSMAVLIHEIWEEFRTRQAGIREEDITKFDIESGLDDPGLSPLAPYHAQHMESDAIERLCIVLAGEDWNEYEKAISYQFKKPVEA